MHPINPKSTPRERCCVPGHGRRRKIRRDLHRPEIKNKVELLNLFAQIDLVPSHLLHSES
jgi:hypothetical protein